MSPINHLPSMDPSQRALDESNNLDRRLSIGVDEKKIEHDPVKEAYKNFSIEKEGTPFTTSFKNFADLIFLKPLGFKTFQESSVEKNNEKYFNAGGPNYLNERDPEKQKTQPQNNKNQKPKEGFSVVATFKSLFKPKKPSVPKQVPIKNPDYKFNFESPPGGATIEVNPVKDGATIEVNPVKDGATIEVKPVSEVAISNQSREVSQEPSRFQEYRIRAGELMAERGVSDGIEWEKRVLVTYPNEENSRDPNNSGVKASSKSSSVQGLDPAEPSSKTPQPPQSLAQIKPTEEQKERLRAAILKRLGQEGEKNSAPVSSEEKLETSQTPLDRSIEGLVSKTEKLKGLVLELQTSTKSLKPQQNNVQEPKDELRESKTLIGATTPALPKENTKTATSAAANNPAHSSPTTPPSVEEPKKEPLPKKVRAPRTIAHDWLNNKPFPRPDPKRRIVDGLLPTLPKDNGDELSTIHPSHFDSEGLAHRSTIASRMAEAREAEKALAELEASKAQKAPSSQTQTAKQQSSTSPCGHNTYESTHTQGGETSFVARLATNGTGGRGRESGG